MLSKGKQNQYIRKRLNDLYSHFNLFIQTKNPEELHQMRLEVKRIKALLLFFEKCLQTHRLTDDFKSVRLIYKNAGEIRKIHINLLLVDKYKIADDVFINGQNEILSKLNNKFMSKKNLYEEIILKIQKKLSKDFENIENNSVLKLYYKKLNSLIRLFSNEKYKNNLHNCRSKVKELLYIYNALNKSFGKKLSLNINYLDQIQNAIGEWHDTTLIVELLKDKKYTNNQVINYLEFKTGNLLTYINSLLFDFSKKIIPKE
ncbi:MAG: CHAD domain-containing protein [Bacteroidota bacterium]|nr:CHAD domain-containing protein [Bacteroidota bacterium]